MTFLIPSSIRRCRQKLTPERQQKHGKYALHNLKFFKQDRINQYKNRVAEAETESRMRQKRPRCRNSVLDAETTSRMRKPQPGRGNGFKNNCSLDGTIKCQYLF